MNGEGLDKDAKWRRAERWVSGSIVCEQDTTLPRCLCAPDVCVVYAVFEVGAMGVQKGVSGGGRE